MSGPDGSSRQKVSAPSRALTVATAAGDTLITRFNTRVFTCTVEFATAGTPVRPFAELEAYLRALDCQFSRFRPDSELSQFNDRAGAWVEVSSPMRRLLRHALNVAVASRGLVNIAVLSHLIRAGYDRSWPAVPVKSDDEDLPLPTPALPLTAVLELQDTRARLLPGHGLDLGAVAKGFWADEIADRLGPNAACNLGGDIACRGKGPTGEGWPVSFPPDDQVFCIADGGIATSGTEKRHWGPHAHHLIDPRTGLPSRSDVTRATVLAKCAATADWAASAAVIGGTDGIKALTRRGDVVRCEITPFARPARSSSRWVHG